MHHWNMRLVSCRLTFISAKPILYVEWGIKRMDFNIRRLSYSLNNNKKQNLVILRSSKGSHGHQFNRVNTEKPILPMKIG